MSLLCRSTGLGTCSLPVPGAGGRRRWRSRARWVGAVRQNYVAWAGTGKARGHHTHVGSLQSAARFMRGTGSPGLCLRFQGLRLGALPVPSTPGVACRGVTRTVQWICLIYFAYVNLLSFFFFLPVFCVDNSGVGFSPAAASRRERPGVGLGREERAVQSCEQAEVGAEGTERGQRTRGTRDWVFLRHFWGCSPKITQGSVPSPAAAAARASPGRMQSGRGGAEQGGRGQGPRGGDNLALALVPEGGAKAAGGAEPGAAGWQEGIWDAGAGAGEPGGGVGVRRRRARRGRNSAESSGIGLAATRGRRHVSPEARGLRPRHREKPPPSPCPDRRKKKKK